MKRKNIVGLIAIVAIIAVVMFVGCIEEEEKETINLDAYVIIQSDYSPYSEASPEDMVYFLQIKNPTLRTVDDEIDQVAYLIENKMKIEHPDAYSYDVMIGDSYYVYINKPYFGKSEIKKVK